MAILAYQVTGFAYQGSGLFAYQGDDDGVVVAQVNSGGYDFPRPYYKTPEDRKRARIDLGIFPEEAKIIDEVAVLQSEQRNLTEKGIKTQLRLAMKARGLEMQVKHLTALNDEREFIITSEIKRLMRLSADNDEIMLLLVAANG